MPAQRYSLSLSPRPPTSTLFPYTTLFRSAEVQQLLQQRRAGRKWYRRWAPRAAVAMALREQAGSLSVLMIERASRVGDPWSGHMAFPGGMMERTDRDSLTTARRETAEERSEEHTSELQSRGHLVCRLLLE